MIELAGALCGSAFMAGLLLVAGARLNLVPELPAWRPSRGAVLRLAAAAGAAAATFRLTGWPVAAVAVAGGMYGLPGVISARSAATQIRRLEALEAWTRRLVDLLGSGAGLEHAIEQSAVRNLSVQIAEPVTALSVRLTTVLMPAEQALRQFADDVDDPVADRIAAALILVSRRRGKGASAVLAGLAELVAKDVQNRREVEAARAEHRSTVRWVIAILLLLTAGAIVQRTYVAPFSTPIGQAVLAAVVACYAGSFLWLHRLATPESGTRFVTRKDEEA